MLVKGTLADVQVKSTPDLKDKSVKFNFLTMDPMQVHEIHISKEMVKTNMYEPLMELQGTELEIAIQLKQVKFQPDPNKPMIDITKFELFRLPKEAEAIHKKRLDEAVDKTTGEIKSTQQRKVA